MNSDLSSLVDLSNEQLRKLQISPEVATKLQEQVEKLRWRRMGLYQPYPKQRRFHQAGATYRKRCLMAGNQVGKTFSASMEAAFHLTGLYPDWWEGRRFSNAHRAWVGGPNSEHVRDNAQRLMFGRPDEPGTGSIPRDCIVQVEKSRGIKHAIDYALIRHVSGRNSYVKFKSYDQETDAWSGDTLSWIWYDEEPPWDKWGEGLTRTNAGDQGRPGMVFLTLTPLLGLTKVAKIFHPRPKEEDSWMVRMGLIDAEHYTPEDIQSIVSSYPEHEQRARIYGFPQLGEGAVFTTPREHWVVEPPERKNWWIYLGGMDFGWDLAFGAVEMAWDREGDVIYALREFRQRQITTAEAASAIRRWGDWLPWSWPHDGWVHDRQSGMTTAQLFGEEGVRMLGEHAQYEDGSAGLEASILEMNNRMAGGRLKVSRNCPMLIEEIETYYRNKGKIVKEDDDLIAAFRYDLMMRRFGVVLDGHFSVPKVVGGADYDPFR